jgi:hypothetical protein
VESAERDAPWVALRELFHRSADRASNALDPGSDHELGDRTGDGGHHKRDAPNAVRPSGLRSIEHRRHECHHDPRDEHGRQHASYERTGQRPRRQHRECRRRYDSREQNAGA